MFSSTRFRERNIKWKDLSNSILLGGFLIIICSSALLPVLGFSDFTSIPSSGSINYLPEMGIHYNTRWGAFLESDEVLHRDFARFHGDGYSVIVLLVDWYRVENKFERGDYDGEYTTGGLGFHYGKQVLRNVSRFIGIAAEHDLGVIVGIGTRWGEDSWEVPDYCIDPTNGVVQGMAIVRSSDVKQGFVDMFTYFVQQLAGTPNIVGWHLLGEPWYWPRELPSPYDDIDQKENFINLFAELASIVKELDGRPVTIAFVNSHDWQDESGIWHEENLFKADFGHDERMFNILDFITFSTTMPLDHPELIETWKIITNENLLVCNSKEKGVWFMGVGSNSDDDEIQASQVRTIMDYLKNVTIEAVMAWEWKLDPPYVGKGFYLVQDMEGIPRPAYYEFTR